MIQKDELECQLMQTDFADRWSAYSPKKVEELLGSAAARAVGYDQQNPHHCYTLFEHMLRTVEYLAPYAQNRGRMGVLLLTAALLHDIGKPEVARWKEWRMVYTGHAPASALLAEPLLPVLGYSADESSLILFFIAHHDDFMLWAMEDTLDIRGPFVTRENLRAHIAEQEGGEEYLKHPEVLCKWNDLLRLCEADVEAQAEVVYWQGEVTNTREHKAKKAKLLMKLLEQIKAENC